MCMSVDLPEPDGPITAANWPFGIAQRDAAQRVHDRVALAVLARHVRSRQNRGRDHCRSLGRGCNRHLVPPCEARRHSMRSFRRTVRRKPSVAKTSCPRGGQARAVQMKRRISLVNNQHTPHSDPIQALPSRVMVSMVLARDAAGNLTSGKRTVTLKR